MLVVPAGQTYFPEVWKHGVACIKVGDFHVKGTLFCPHVFLLRRRVGLLLFFRIFSHAFITSVQFLGILGYIGSRESFSNFTVLQILNDSEGVDDEAFDAGQLMEVAWVRVYGSTWVAKAPGVWAEDEATFLPRRIREAMPKPCFLTFQPADPHWRGTKFFTSCRAAES